LAEIFFPRERNTITTSPSPPPHCRHLRRCTAATFTAVLPPPGEDSKGDGDGDDGVL